jgi:predicted nucleic acid-binding protein
VQVALDTNVLVYAEGIAPTAADRDKPVRARRLLRNLPQDEVVLPVQVLGELYRVLAGKARWAPEKARTAILGWRDLYAVQDTTGEVIAAAVDLAADHHLSIWDAVVLAAAAEARCRIVLSEDLQHDFTWRGLTVVNPFAAVDHPLLAGVIGPQT